jgi:formate dehydrogenase subunit gamma
VVVALTVLGLVIYHLIRGPIRLRSAGPAAWCSASRRSSARNHWMVATSFVLLALTGLNITYGAYALRR